MNDIEFLWLALIELLYTKRERLNGSIFKIFFVYMIIYGN